jgi:crossover junction endodeoxyribonuclease RusA
MVTVDLPYPPSVNSLYFNLPGGGGRAKTLRYREWKKEAAWLISIARKGERLGAYGLTVLAGRPDKRRRDLGNLLKAIEDALVEGGAIEDDSECQCIEMSWQPGITGVRVTVLPTARRE